MYLNKDHSIASMQECYSNMNRKMKRERDDKGKVLNYNQIYNQ